MNALNYLVCFKTRAIDRYDVKFSSGSISSFPISIQIFTRLVIYITILANLGIYPRYPEHVCIKGNSCLRLVGGVNAEIAIHNYSFFCDFMFKVFYLGTIQLTFYLHENCIPLKGIMKLVLFLSLS